MLFVSRHQHKSRVGTATNNSIKDSIDLLHKSEKGEAFADKNPGFTDKFWRKCFAPTAENRLLQEV